MSQPPVRVGLELTALELDAAGTARAVRGLAEALERRDGVEVVPLAHPRRRAGRGRVARGLDRELRWWPAGLARAAREGGVDVLHCPVPPGVVRTGAIPLVVTVHDILPLEHPGWYSHAHVAQQRLALRGALRRAAAVVAPSAATADAVAARFGVRPRVVPWGVDARFSPGEATPPIGGPYVVTVATLQPRKNLEALLAAWPHVSAPHTLVIVGARGWHDADLAREIGDSPQFRVTGRVGDEELVELLRGADALVHPSRHEGFGFPPLEAMACGTPVVVANAASLPEVVGDAGVLVDVDDPVALARALDDLLGDPARRAELRERGLARAAAFTWDACAAAMEDVYREAHGG